MSQKKRQSHFKTKKRIRTSNPKNNKKILKNKNSSPNQPQAPSADPESASSTIDDIFNQLSKHSKYI